MRPVVRINLRCSLVQLNNAERVHLRVRHAVMMEVQKQNAQQHQHRASQGVEEELNGGVELARAAPDPNQQVHGNQHRFPEDEEQEEIQRHEDAEHARLQKQKPDVVFLDPIL